MFKKKEKQYNTLKSTMFSFVFKIWTVHITIFAMYLIALILMSGILASNESLMYTIACCISTAFYIVLVYLESWRIGMRDMNLVLYKHISENKYKGMIAAVLSQLPGIICTIFILSPLEIGFFSKFYRFFYLDLTYMVNALESASKLIYIVPILPCLILTPLAYYLGYHEKRILNKVMFKTNKSSN